MTSTSKNGYACIPVNSLRHHSTNARHSTKCISEHFERASARAAAHVALRTISTPKAPRRSHVHTHSDCIRLGSAHVSSATSSAKVQQFPYNAFPACGSSCGMLLPAPEQHGCHSTRRRPRVPGKHHGGARECGGHAGKTGQTCSLAPALRSNVAGATHAQTHATHTPRLCIHTPLGCPSQVVCGAPVTAVF